MQIDDRNLTTSTEQTETRGLVLKWFLLLMFSVCFGNVIYVYVGQNSELTSEKSSNMKYTFINQFILMISSQCQNIFQMPHFV